VDRFQQVGGLRFVGLQYNSQLKARQQPTAANDAAASLKENIISWFASWFDDPTEECQQLQRHPLMGAKIIADGDSALLQSASTTALGFLLSGQLALILAIKQRWAE
jgi:hypothetical protein